MKAKILLPLAISISASAAILSPMQPARAQIAPPSGHKSPTFRDRIDWLDSQLSALDRNVFAFLRDWTSIFKLVPIDEGILNDVNALSSLVARLIDYPSEVSGWWDVLARTASSEYNSCASVASSIQLGQTPAFVPDPDWCIFARQRAVYEDGTPVPERPGFYGRSDSGGPFGEPAGRKKEVKVESSADLAEVMGDSMGVAGVPLLQRLRYRVLQEVNDGNYVDNFITQKHVKADFAQTGVHRAFASFRAHGVLSDTGQLAQQKTAGALVEASAEAISATRTALESDVTQDVMKGMAKANLNNTILLGSVAAVQQRQLNDAAVTSIQLNDISRGITTQNRRVYTDRSASMASMLRQSQAGLF